jgi:hypothetical protein
MKGSHFVNKMARLVDHSAIQHLHSTTKDAISRNKASRKKEDEYVYRESKATQHWKKAAGLALRWSKSRAHYQDQLNACNTEHMSIVDPFDGEKARSGQVAEIKQGFDMDEDLVTVFPAVDGRLKDEGGK